MPSPASIIVPLPPRRYLLYRHRIGPRGYTLLNQLALTLSVGSAPSCPRWGEDRLQQRRASSHRFPRAKPDPSTNDNNGGDTRPTDGNRETHTHWPRIQGSHHTCNPGTNRRNNRVRCFLPQHSSRAANAPARRRFVRHPSSQRQRDWRPVQLVPVHRTSKIERSKAKALQQFSRSCLLLLLAPQTSYLRMVAFGLIFLSGLCATCAAGSIPRGPHSAVFRGTGRAGPRGRRAHHIAGRISKRRLTGEEAAVAF